MEHQPTDWPFWITLGGDTIMPCVRSLWLATLYIILCAGIVIGYFVIGFNWWKLEGFTHNEQERRMLVLLKHIFLGCGISGYGFMIVRSLWPIWSLYILSLVWLNWVTWAYVLELRKIK